MARLLALAITRRAALSRPSEQSPDMGFDAAAERIQLVATLEHGDDTTSTVSVSNTPNLPRDPGVIILDPRKTGDLVIHMRIETGRDQNQLRPVHIERRQPARDDGIAKRRAITACRQRHVNGTPAPADSTGVRIEWMLESRTEQYPVVILENVLGTIAVMHIEIDDGDTLETMALQCMDSCDRDIIEQAETHRTITLGMMPRWPHAAERRLRGTFNDQIDREHTGAGGAQGSIQTMRIHASIRIEKNPTLTRRHREYPLDIVGIVRTA